ncbi:MAG: GGDEF domain-containing protein, partial [Chitinivibrionales bacterium]|nr:GGDEF domain-containing protein [Chitinivibrionales bacterium]
YGHQFGDTILKNIAATLEGSVRESVDIAARYGGEEFALVLVKTDAAQAQERAERIRAGIAAAVHKTPQGAPFNLSMSFGIASLGEHVKNVPTLIEKADKALYRAKENGRNRVEVF